MRLVFMGTPAFVVPVLEALLAEAEVQVVGVYTQPDRPRGRGRTVELTPVKSAGVNLGLPVFQPVSLRSARAQQELADLRPDVILVTAYGRFLPPEVLGPSSPWLFESASLAASQVPRPFAGGYHDSRRGSGYRGYPNAIG